MTSMQGSDVYAGGTKRDPKNLGTFSSEAGGAIKAYNNFMEGSYTFIPYGASKYVLKGKETAVGSIDSKADFDAYVVSSRDAQVPPSVKSYEGANAYNNFDTDKSVMYSYTAESPEVARENVIAYAGRVQGGDFKWTFNNSVDDASSDVNQPLKDALVAYKGWNGIVTPQSSSSETSVSSSSSAKSSSSSAPASSSSSAKSSSSEKVSSSSVAEESSSSTLASSSSSAPVEDLSSSSSETDALPVAMPRGGETMRFLARESRLEVYAAGSFRVDVVRMDGTRVLASSARVVDLSGLRAGVYVVRLVSAGSALQLKILKSAP